MPESKPTITTRISIAWLPDPPSEPTSTLVLSTPNGRFVDIRLTLSLTHPSDIGACSLELANAGTGTYGVDNDGRKWGRWTHEIDSRPGFSVGEKDVEEDMGWMRTLGNGDTLEEGRMKDSQGVLRDYEEIWRTTPIVDSADKESGWKIVDSVEKGFEGSDAEKKIRAILGGRSTFRTVVMRVDRYAQGILKVDSESQEKLTDAVVFRAERGTGTDSDAWKVVWSQNDLAIVKVLLSFVVEEN